MKEDMWDHRKASRIN